LFSQPSALPPVIFSAPLFRARFVCFQQLAASGAKNSGVDMGRCCSFAVSTAENRAHTGSMAHDIAATSNAWKEKRMALKATRDSLFREYIKHPQEYRLALEIKTIDDEIAECNEKEQEGNERSKVRRQRTLVSS
jgi:hypothetical protein